MDKDNTDQVSTMHFNSDDAQTVNLGQSPERSNELREQFYDRLRKLNEDDGKYVIQQKVAEGGMGAIYKVYDRGLKRELVLKVILPGVLDDPLLFQRFIEEAQITGRLEHPNIIPVHDIGVLGGQKLFFSMKFVEGRSLSGIMKGIRDGDGDTLRRYTRYHLLTIFRKVCDAVAFAHSKNVLHRDIKPENIMVGSFGEVLLMDWGLARLIDQLKETPSVNDEEDDIFDPIKTRYGVVKGTPAYMAPEQAKGSVEEIDERSDIFLLGATLYAIATHQAPYTGDDVYEILANAENGNYVEPSLRAPEQQLPLELVRIITRAMAYDKADRYQNVAELCVDIDALLEGNTTSNRKQFETGEIILREGDPGDEAYVILSGHVEVYKTVRGKKVTLISLGEGDVIGEMALISQAPRSASIVALEDTEVVVITKEVMEQGLGQLPPWMGKVVDCMAERLAAANTQIHPLMSGDATFHVLQQLRYIHACSGLPKVDNYTEKLTIVVNTKMAIQEIATCLCISRDRVAMVFSRLLESNLIKPFGSDGFVIPNVELFIRFVTFCRRQQGLEGGFEPAAKTAVFASDNEFVVQHTIDLEKGAGELEPVVPYPPDKVINASTDEEITAKFERIFDRIRDMQKAPVSNSVIAQRSRDGSHR